MSFPSSRRQRRAPLGGWRLFGCTQTATGSACRLRVPATNATTNDLTSPAPRAHCKRRKWKLSRCIKFPSLAVIRPLYILTKIGVVQEQRIPAVNLLFVCCYHPLVVMRGVYYAAMLLTRSPLNKCILLLPLWLQGSNPCGS